MCLFWVNPLSRSDLHPYDGDESRVLCINLIIAVIQSSMGCSMQTTMQVGAKTRAVAEPVETPNFPERVKSPTPSSPTPLLPCAQSSDVESFFSATAGSSHFNHDSILPRLGLRQHILTSTSPIAKARDIEHSTAVATTTNDSSYSNIPTEQSRYLGSIIPQSWLVIPKRRIPCSSASAQRKLQRQES